MYKFTEDFLLIYFNKAKHVDYQELTTFLDLSFSELLLACNALEEKGQLVFEEGRFRTTDDGIEKINSYDIEVFDFSNGIKLKDYKTRYLFKDVNYIPKVFSKY